MGFHPALYLTETEVYVEVWGEFVENFGYKATFELCLSSDVDGQTERIIQSLEDLLGAYVLEQ